jgi:hypothetical protein
MLAGFIVVPLVIILLVRYAIDVAGIVFVLMVTGFGFRTVSDWLSEGDSTAGWALGGVGLGIVGTLLVSTWLFGSASVGTEMAFHDHAMRGLTAAVEWAEDHGWGQRALLPGGALERARQRELNTGAVRAGVTGAPGSASQAPVIPPRSTARPAAPTANASRPEDLRRQAKPARVSGVAAMSTPTVQTQDPVVTTTALNAAPTTSRVGTSVLLTATVDVESDALVQGMVAFRGDDVLLGSVRLPALPRTSTVYMIARELPVGAHRLVAEFTGHGRLAQSHSAVVEVTITR